MSTALLRCLGGLGLAPSGFARRKPLLLLCYLALEGPQPRERLATLFWPHATDARNRLSVALSRIRRGLPGVLAVDGQWLDVRLDTDVALLRDVLESGEAMRAASLYTGAFLAGETFPDLGVELEEWIVGTRERIARRVREARLRAAEAAVTKGRFDLGAAHAEAALEVPGAPELEPAALQRLHALLVAGGSTAAATLRADAAELGLELETERARARGRLLAAAPPGNLPRQVTSFMGRDHERIELARILDAGDRPLLTLLGPGGIGKTRLALALACDQRDAGMFSGGVHFVPLESLGGPAEFPTAIASALKVVPGARETALEAVARRVGAQRTLLLLDNFETVAEGAEALAELLARCPNLFALVTSRVRLELEEESVFPVEGLPLPSGAPTPEAADGSPAVRLFTERARRSRLDFTPSPSDLAAIAEICRLVGGAPLGIELAAVWVRQFDPAEIERELRSAMDALESPSRNIAERHRTLRASFEYSWRMLAPDERASLRRLAVFRGGFEATAARYVAGVTRKQLARLRDLSLLRCDDAGLGDDSGDGGAERTARFGTHPVVRAFVREQLDAVPDDVARLRARHARWARTVVRRESARFYGAHQHLAQARLERERSDIDSALDWAVEHDSALALGMVGDLRWFWRFSGSFAEGRAQAERALASTPAADAATPERGRALVSAAAMAYRAADYRSARSRLATALELARALDDPELRFAAQRLMGDVAFAEEGFEEAAEWFASLLADAATRTVADGGVAWRIAALTGLGRSLAVRGALAEAERHFTEALELGVENEASASVVTAHFNLGALARDRGDWGAAERHYERALRGDAALGDRWGFALTTHELGGVAYARGEYGLAERRFEEALELHRALGDAAAVADARFALGLTARRRNRSGEALEHYLAVVDTWLHLDQEARAAPVVGALANLANAQGHATTAARLWGAADALAERSGRVRPPDGQAAYERDQAATRERLGDAGFERAWREGREAPLRNLVRGSASWLEST